MTTDEFADVYDGFNRMTRGLEERERLRDAFGRYVAPEVADEIMRGPASLRGSTVDATVVFADIRGFTALSERLRPAEVVAFLNRYVAAVEPAIRAERGYINKFGGDSILAVFGAPVAEPEHVKRAVRAALGMSAALARFNAVESASGLDPVRIGIGIHCGEMVAGSVGSTERMEYTVIGDVVNVASRIQSLNKDYGTEILVSHESLRAHGRRGTRASVAAGDGPRQVGAHRRLHARSGGVAGADRASMIGGRSIAGACALAVSPRPRGRAPRTPTRRSRSERAGLGASPRVRSRSRSRRSRSPNASSAPRAAPTSASCALPASRRRR